MYKSQSKTALYKNLGRAGLVMLCIAKLKGRYKKPNADYDSMSMPELITAVSQARREDGITDDADRVIGGKSRKTRVLGKTTLREIRHDMARQKFPSWFARAPGHPGESKWGKFTADQWKAFCTVHLPTTLTRLWGSKPSDSTERMMLDNFMHLVQAVKAANARVITREHIAQYEHHITAYVTQLLRLYPGTTITPYQHLSLHFGRLLRNIGPTHAWRCFNFERYNYLM
ncbi:hypothetical protein HGRIS_001183 [Hohenbuehelia grisea]|uniref:DUF4218 domain-containing protein n=1 Tax=Hohenbuehelia grisea TaxID=104357 RepID=A0ABR3JPA9_9AGAR